MTSGKAKSDNNKLSVNFIAEKCIEKCIYIYLILYDYIYIYWILRGSCGTTVSSDAFITAMFDDLHLVRWMWLQTAGCYADGVGGSRIVAEVPLRCAKLGSSGTERCAASSTCILSHLISSFCHQTFKFDLWLEAWRICNDFQSQCSVLFDAICNFQVFFVRPQSWNWLGLLKLCKIVQGMQKS